jgi:lipoyl(octanoyl) transferase
MKVFNYFLLNTTPYEEGLDFQQFWFDQQLEKKATKKSTSNTLILLQHTPVYTLGKSGDIKNLKVPIEETGADYFQTTRGGDITYHGPGQITGYPVFDLDSFDMGVRTYVETIEECIIDCLTTYGLKGTRIDTASGVWIDAQTENPRKICAVGIKVSRNITMHGFAFNINTDLSYFENIVPCGLDDKGVTSIAKELGQNIDIIEVKKRLIDCFNKRFIKV